MSNTVICDVCEKPIKGQRFTVGVRQPPAAIWDTEHDFDFCSTDCLLAGVANVAAMVTASASHLSVVPTPSEVVTVGWGRIEGATSARIQGAP